MNALVVARREFGTFLASPAPYWIGAFFLLITGLIFSFNITTNDKASLAPVFRVAGTMLIFLIPVLTTHLVIRESQHGTLEILMTSPIYVWEIVIGKFIAAFSFFLFIISPTAIYLLLLSYFGQPDLPVVLSGYVGLFFLGGLFISLGVFSSSICSSQLTAIILSITLSTTFWFVDRLGLAFSGDVSTVFLYLSPQYHFLDLIVGIMKLSSITYFLSMTVGILLITIHILKMRLWH